MFKMGSIGDNQSLPALFLSESRIYPLLFPKLIWKSCICSFLGESVPYFFSFCRSFSSSVSICTLYEWSAVETWFVHGHEPW